MHVLGFGIGSVFVPHNGSDVVFGLVMRVPLLREPINQLIHILVVTANEQVEYE
jgi:hypothetical protein